jgi:hypothetical protein
MKIALFLLAAMLSLAPARAQVANEQSYTGHLEYHNQVEFVTIPISAGLGNLRVWTDSYANSANIDPIITVWHNGVKIGMNDDNATFTPFQTSRDSGIALPALPWGSYVVTITAYPNFPLGNLLENGFAYDSQTPATIEVWCQPGHPGPGCYTRHHISLHWTID